MDLKTYEHLKFRLADIIRAGQHFSAAAETESARRAQLEAPWRDLLTRLAEDRFTVVMAGRFSQGKSSLMNAVLGVDRLPTGIVPLTSVITLIRYGTKERVLLEYENWGLRQEVKLEELAQYVTERGNPGNTKGIRGAEIQLPAEVLRRGIVFVDTPGLGSAIFENSETTERFLPEIDVLILVTSYESPLTEDELRFLEQASRSVQAVFVVVNKHDTVARDQRDEVLAYVERITRGVLGDAARAPFSVSARDGLAAKMTGDSRGLRVSGIQEFEAALIPFLTDERAKLFLAAMCDRIRTELLPLADPGAGDLLATLDGVRGQIDSGRKGHSRNAQATESPAPQAMGCEICKTVLETILSFLSRYQYALSTQSSVQEAHAMADGFCPLHTWHYEQIASPRGVCTAYPALLRRIAGRLRAKAAIDAREGDPNAPLLDPSCPACRVRWATEDRAVSQMLGQGESTHADHMPLCLPHLELLLARSLDQSRRHRLLTREAALFERLADDMQRYAIKFDGLRRGLASKEEAESPLRALQMLVGHRSVNAVFTVRDIL
jgi:GTP-binding protein EngB required for normal cell division